MKVHFASGPGEEVYLKAAGINYSLFSYHYLRGKSAPIPAIKFMNECKHAIMDSGLFTMMFGSEAHIKRTEQDLIKMLDDYAQFVIDHNYKHSMVEYDVQKIFSPELAWDLRRHLKAKVPNTVINVYHLEDGNPDKLIEFSDYMAVSIPELRKHSSRKELIAIGDYILNKCVAKGKRVHMLGCTEKSLLMRWRAAYSCDSSTWKSMARWNNFKLDSGDIPILKKQYVDQVDDKLGSGKSVSNSFYYSARILRIQYEKWAGRQD